MCIMYVVCGYVCVVLYAWCCMYVYVCIYVCMYVLFHNETDLEYNFCTLLQYAMQLP